MKVELEEVYKMIDDDIERGKEIPWPEEYADGRTKSLEILKYELQNNFPEYVVCFGNINRRFGAALAILSNDTTDLNDVRVLRLTTKQAREKLDKGEIVFSGADFGKYFDMLEGSREVSIINRAMMKKQEFIDTYLTEESVEDDE